MADDGKVHYFISPDNITYSNLHMTPNELAANNAPLSAIGTRVLMQMCIDEYVVKALDVAVGICKRVDEAASTDEERELLALPSGSEIH